LVENYKAQGFENMNAALPVTVCLFRFSRTKSLPELIAITPSKMDTAEN
jgi:hypothetical protein